MVDENSQWQYRNSYRCEVWLVLDVDDGGNETISALEATHGKLPDTVTAVTGRGGRHYIFKYPKGRSIPNKTKFAPGLDTRSNGGLIVVPPSIHVSGNRYEWIKDQSPFDRTLAEAPEWLLKLMERVEVLLTPFEGSSITAEIMEGSRNSTLTSLAGTKRTRDKGNINPSLLGGRKRLGRCRRVETLRQACNVLRRSA